jgi:thymidine kinase
MSEARKQYDRERSARRYALKRQDVVWMRQQAAKKKRVYKFRNGAKYHRNNIKKRNKALVAQLKLAAQECYDCGLTITVDTLYLFDFDHREPRLKKFTLSQVRTESLQAIKDEAEKCDVVCKNCHAHRTHRQRKDEHVQIIREGRQRQRTTLLEQRGLFDEAT